MHDHVGTSSLAKAQNVRVKLGTISYTRAMEQSEPCRVRTHESSMEAWTGPARRIRAAF